MALFSSRDNEYEHHSDSDIIILFRKSGDTYFAGVLYKRYGHLVLGLCLKYLRNKMEAEDAVMNIFTKLLDDLKKHKVDHFKSWLYVYSKNHCLMILRKRQSSLKRELEIKEDTMLVMDFSDGSHLKEREEQIQMLEQAIDDLSEEQKKCVRMFYLDNLSYVQIAEATGFSGNEVKSHIQNGKRNLKIRLETKMNERSRE
jgi:RNA polymerase sigma factor (sigma-70 family)